MRRAIDSSWFSGPGEGLSGHETRLAAIGGSGPPARRWGRCIVEALGLVPAAADPAAQDGNGVLAQAAGEMHQRLEKRPGGQPENGADHRASFRAESEELRDDDKGDDEERRREGDAGAS